MPFRERALPSEELRLAEAVRVHRRRVRRPLNGMAPPEAYQCIGVYRVSRISPLAGYGSSDKRHRRETSLPFRSIRRASLPRISVFVRTS
jgi:hypothetical protein